MRLVKQFLAWWKKVRSVRWSYVISEKQLPSGETCYIVKQKHQFLFFTALYPQEAWSTRAQAEDRVDELVTIYGDSGVRFPTLSGF